MANLKAKDADSITHFIKSSGIGTDDDPFIIEHSNAPLLAQLQQAVQQLTTVIGQLQDVATIRNQLQNALPVNATIGNFPASQAVSGTVAVSNFPASQAVSGNIAVSNFPANQAVSGTVAVSNFPASQAVSGNIAVSNFPASQAVSGNIAVSNFPSIQTITDIQVTNIESAIALGANGNFTGPGRDGLNRNTVRGWVLTNANGTLYVDQSINNTTWRQTEVIAITGNANQATDYLFRLCARYFRLRYTNGNTAQTSFELISTMFGIGL